MNVEMVTWTPDPELLIERAARLCYDSADKIGPGTAATKIASLIKSGHESVLEHASITFLLGGVSRALTHQLVRHRIASYSQRSQRYVKETEPQYVTPPSCENNLTNANSIFEEAMEGAWRAYNDLLKLGIKGEDARFVLPNACYTEIFVTMNLRELRHFFKLRTSSHAQWEIRNMAKIMHKYAMDIAPSVFKDIVFEE